MWREGVIFFVPLFSYFTPLLVAVPPFYYFHSYFTPTTCSTCKPPTSRLFLLQYLHTQEGREVDACRTLLHSMGNVMNSLVFGHRYSWEDATWRWLQHLAEDGVKHIGVAGPLNFLPFLRYSLLWMSKSYFYGCTLEPPKIPVFVYPVPADFFLK